MPNHLEAKYLEILKELGSISDKLCELWGDAVDLDESSAARISLWIAVLNAIIDDAEENDMVDTLDLHPEFIEGADKDVH